MSCLRAIAGGDTRLNEIAQRIGRTPLRGSAAVPRAARGDGPGAAPLPGDAGPPAARSPTRSPIRSCASGFASSPRAKAVSAPAPRRTAISPTRSCRRLTSSSPRTLSSGSARTGWGASWRTPSRWAGGGDRSGAGRTACCAAAPTRPTRSPPTRREGDRPRLLQVAARTATTTISTALPSSTSWRRSGRSWGCRTPPSTSSTGSDFSPRLHELAAERDDVRLVPVRELG